MNGSLMRFFTWRSIAIGALFTLCLGHPSAAAAAELSSSGDAPAGPLHERIDRAIEAKLTTPAADICTDAEFVRRVYLDLTGTIPTPDDVRSFLGDTSPDRRSQLIDRLLETTEYLRHMRQTFDVMLMERRQGGHVPQSDWEEYLQRAIEENRPYNELAREILASDGVDPKTRPAAKFFMDRDGETHTVTRDVGRLMLGANLQCAQCHDHPHVADYTQDRYYGIYAFLDRSFLFNDKQLGKQVIAEKAEGEVKYNSVFDVDDQRNAAPVLPGVGAMKEPELDEDKMYVVKMDEEKGVRPIPAFSYRTQLAEMATAGQNAEFNRNIANRLWALVMGRGIVEPLDMTHPDNPPSHPELLEMLGREFAAMQFDIKAFLRQLVLSKTYQRSTFVPTGIDKEKIPEDSFAVAILRPLTPEQLTYSMLQATGEINARWAAARDALVEEDAAASKATEEKEESHPSEEKTEAPKTPVTPDTPEVRLRKKFNQLLADDMQSFVTLFGTPPGELPRQFAATPAQSLFLANGPVVRGWLASKPDNLIARASQLDDPATVADAIYLKVLSREPDDEERADVVSFLNGWSGDRQAALVEIAWALLASAEFRFNH